MIFGALADPLASYLLFAFDCKVLKMDPIVSPRVRLLRERDAFAHMLIKVSNKHV